METNFDSSTVPNLNIVVEEIFSSCTKNSRDAVPASTLIEFMKPHLSNHLIGLTQLCFILDPNNDNPLISRDSFYEAMRKWTTKMNEGDSKLLSFSFKATDVLGGNVMPINHSTPKPSLEPTAMKNSTDSLDFSNLSPTSFTANTKDNSMGMDKVLFIEERYQELEHKHLNTVRELSLLKTQLVASEEQYAELKQDLDRTNKRLMLEQQVNADLQKSMEHNDEFKEEVCNTKKEKDHLQKLWLITKRENVNLLGQIKELEYEKETLERKLNDLLRKEEQKKKEFCDLQVLFTLYEDENKLLKKSKLDLEDELQDTKSSLDHYREVSEILKNKIQALTSVHKKKGIDSKDQILEKVPSDSSNSSGTPINSPSQSQIKSSTPLKHIPQSWQRDYVTFASPKLQRQLSSPITPGGLGTPLLVKTNFSFAKSENIHESYNSPRSEVLKSVFYSPKKMLSLNSSKSGHSKNLPPVELCGEIYDLVEKRCFFEKAVSESSLQSENSVLEAMEDLDLSSFSDNLKTFNGKDLLSELQECKFLDNHNKCYVEEHDELLKISKEHENCLKIISEKEKEIELIKEEIEVTKREYNNFLNKYESLEMISNNTKCENIELIEKNNIFADEIIHLKEELELKHKELAQFINSERNNQHLIKELNDLKEERDIMNEKYNKMINEKNHLIFNCDNFKMENDNLLKEKNYLSIEIKNLSSLIEVKEKELYEMQILRAENEQLKNEVELIKTDLKQACEKAEILSKQLQTCRENGKSLFEKLLTKIQQQNCKFKSLEVFNLKLQEYVDEINNVIETGKKKNTELMHYTEENLVCVRCTQKIDDEDSASTGSSEHSHRRSRQSSYERKSNYDKQQLIIIKLEEKIEDLENELMNERTSNKNLRIVESQINELEMEKINYQKERDSILRELEIAKHDLHMKDQMMKQYEEKLKLDLENLNQSYEEKIMMRKVTEIEALERTESFFMQKIEELNRVLDETVKKKDSLESMLKKKEDKILSLEKTLSDEYTSSRDLELLVIEKESMLKSNREQLQKSSDSLKQAENRCLFLKVLLDKCKMDLLETVDGVLRYTVEAYHSYKPLLEENRIDSKLLQELDALDFQKAAVCDFTEKEIWLAHKHLQLTIELLKNLVFISEKTSSTGNIMESNISKFTLRPSKLKLHPLHSCDSNILSYMKDEEQQHNTKVGMDSCSNSAEELGLNEKFSYVNNLSEKDSETSWLHPYTDHLREEMNNRKLTEKKFILLSSTWKLNFENTRKKFRSSKRRCISVRKRYLLILLEIVTHVKNHKCHQEQKTLIQALKLVEKLKDLLFDVFKLAEQYGASRQELHSIKCWNLIVEYVNELHQENDLLRLYQCTSAQITSAANNSDDNDEETIELKKSFRSVGVGDSIIDESFKPNKLIRMKRRKCPLFLMLLSVLVCLLAMCIFFIHIECLRNGGLKGNIMCPLDFLVSIKKESTCSSNY